MPLDQWCARNLGFLAVIGGIFIGLLLGPLLLLLFIIGPMYAFQGFQFMPWYQMLSSLVTICLSAFLLGYGCFLLVHYFRYPTIGFQMPKRVFWLTSVIYCPAWLLPALLSADYPIRIPPREYLTDLAPWPYLGAALLILPITHITFSIVALIHTNKIAEQADAVNPHACGTFGTSAAEQPLVPKASGDT